MKKEGIRLSDHFTYKKLLRFTLPSVVMMVFMSVYTLTDGFFVSNFVGKTQFAALNLIWPVIMITAAVGIMLGTGGNAVIGKALGENDRKKANEYFSMLVFVLIAFSLAAGIIMYIFAGDIAYALGARGQMLSDCISYGGILMLAMPFFVVGYAMQSLFITAQKPGLGLFFTVLGGCLNIALDAFFIIVLDMGLSGAAIATAIGQGAASLPPLIYFCCPNSSLLRITLKTRLYLRVLLKTCANGSSEMVTNIAQSVVSILYNAILLDYYGENGVAAYGILMYVGFIFGSVFFGYSMGAAAPVSFHFGAKNKSETLNIFKKSLVLTASCGAALTVLCFLSAPLLGAVFIGYDEELLNLTTHALYIYSASFLFMGFSSFGSSFFTALSDGKTSAEISFIRTFVFQIGALILLPRLLGEDGIWLSTVAAEAISGLLTAFFCIKKRALYSP